MSIKLCETHGDMSVVMKYLRKLIRMLAIIFYEYKALASSIIRVIRDFQMLIRNVDLDSYIHYVSQRYQRSGYNNYLDGDYAEEALSLY